MKKFFSKITFFLAKIFGGLKKFEAFLEDHVDDAIDITLKIRQLVASPTVTSLLLVLPDKYKTQGAAVQARIQEILDKAINELQLGEKCLQKATFPERLQCLVEEIRKLSPAMQSGAFLKLASLYAKNSSGAQAKESVFDTAVQGRLLDLKFSITA